MKLVNTKGYDKVNFRWRDRLLVGLPGEVDVPEESDDRDYQRSQEKRGEVEVGQLNCRPNLRRKLIFLKTFLQTKNLQQSLFICILPMFFLF